MAYTIEKVAFELPAYRGFTCKASYLVASQNALIEIFKDGAEHASYEYPAYRIWNIAAHFTDMVDEELELAEQRAGQ